MFYRILLLVAIFLLSSCTHHNVSLQQEKSPYKSLVPINQNIDVAVVLGSGGVRAIAALGVFEVLEEHNIKVDLIVGTSGGSIFGALYADNPDANKLKKTISDLETSDFVEFSWLGALKGAYSLSSGYANSKNGEKFLLTHLHAKEFKELKIPFIAVATDIVTGETVPMNNGFIAPAVMASCAIPAVFPPVKIYNKILVDGAVSDPIAVDVAQKYKPKLIIAVDINPPLIHDHVHNIFDVISKSLSINRYTLNNLLVSKADIIINPEVSDIGLFDSHRKNELFAAGKKATELKIEKIKKLLNSKSSIIDNILYKKKL